MYNLKHETETTAESLGLGGSATGTQDGHSKGNPENAAYKDTVNNFSTAFAENLAAFNNLTEVNQHLNTTVVVSVTGI